MDRANAARPEKNTALVRTGVIGAGIAAICCFTPVLVILLGALGLSAWLGWADYVLFPALAMFAAITLGAGWRLWQRQRA